MRLGARLEDSVQAGYVGLLEAALPKYKLNSGVTFMTFAYDEIKHYIQQEANDNITTVALPSRSINKISKFIEAEKSHAQKFSELPDWPDLVADGDVDAKSASAIAYLLEYNSSQLPDIIENCEDKKNDYELKDIEIDVGILLGTLKSDENEIIRRYFGVGRNRETLEEIGIRYNITTERVRQIIEKVLSKLKESAKRLEVYNPNARQSKKREA